MKKKYIAVIIVILVVVIDLSVLLYPTVSDYINAHSQSRVVAKYIDDVAGIDDNNAQALLDAARAYNQTLLTKTDRFQFTSEEMAAYQKLLDVSGGVMGILVIDKINVKLPIYHGTDEGVLQVGLGHLPGSSLPVGGVGTHTIITGHRGLPSSTLLIDLNKMAEGHTFVLYVLGETLTYQVDEIDTVEPQQVEELTIDPNMDYCTLVTCTPYGINTHRLLVRGHRIENASDTQWIFSADADRLDKAMILLIFNIPVLPILLIYGIVKYRKIRKGAIVR